MAEYLIQDSTLINIADAVRAKTGKTGTIMVSSIADEITAISTGVDTSDATAVAGDILNGKTAYVKGQKVTGNIPTKSASNLTASGATVTVPAGYYASQATKSVSSATQATPSVSINSSGLITASATQTAGYVAAGTKSGTKQLTTQAAKTVTPSSAAQTAVASGVYTTGAITVAAIPSSYTQLNFSVVGGTSAPANPANNTIWVNTNVAIPVWSFIAVNPNWAVIEGQIYIVAKTSTNNRPADFNALKSNEIWIEPCCVWQYVNGAWSKKDAKIYKNGQWIPLELILYQNGAFNTTVFGSVTHNGYIHANGNGVNDGSIGFSRYGNLRTTTAVDITPYSTFAFDIVWSNYGRPRVQIISMSNKVLAEGPQVQGVNTFTLDVSAINEPVYVDIYVYGNANDDSTRLNNLKFLP